MKPEIRMLVIAVLAGAALSTAPLFADARPGGGGGGGGVVGGGGGAKGGWGGGPGYNGGGNGGGYRGGGYRGGGYGHGGHGHWHGGYGGWYGWGYRGYWGAGYYWPGYYWGVGAGLATVAYAAPYYNYYGGYYGYPANVAPVTEYVVSEPQSGDRVVRSGQPVPQTPQPEPIFYPRSGQTPAQTEADRQECNRWATTQQNALSDAQVFQRATFACMDGRGYTVR